MIVKTNYNINIQVIKEAVSQLPNENKLTLNTPTGNFFYDPWKIKEEFVGTCWETILSSLNESFGEARIIRLLPGTCYFSHADIDNRWHLSLTGNQSYLINLEDCSMHKLKLDGNWYFMDASKRHTAANFGQIDRYQLVVRKLLKSNNLVQPSKIQITQNEKTYDFRYLFDNEISPWLNKANNQGKISNFNFRDQEVSFDISEEFIEELLQVGKNFKISII